MGYIIAGCRHLRDGDSWDHWVYEEEYADAEEVYNQWVDEGYDSVTVAAVVTSTDYTPNDLLIESPKSEYKGDLPIPSGWKEKLSGRINSEDMCLTKGLTADRWARPQPNMYGHSVTHAMAVIERNNK